MSVRPVWKSIDPRNNMEVPYPADFADKLEAAYNSAEKAPQILQVGPNTFTVDVVRMIQTNSSGGSRPVKRVNGVSGDDGQAPAAGAHVAAPGVAAASNLPQQANHKPQRQHPGSLSGCGGNVDGVSDCVGNGNCGSGCVRCGAGTHWNCCGSSNTSSTHCAAGVSIEQARKNVQLLSSKQVKPTPIRQISGVVLPGTFGGKPVPFRQTDRFEVIPPRLKTAQPNEEHSEGIVPADEKEPQKAQPEAKKEKPNKKEDKKKKGQAANEALAAMLGLLEDAAPPQPLDGGEPELSSAMPSTLTADYIPPRETARRLIEILLAEAAHLSPQEREDIRRSMLLLADYEWPDVLRSAEARAAAAVALPAAGGNSASRNMWGLIRDLALAQGFPEELSPELRSRVTSSTLEKDCTSFKEAADILIRGTACISLFAGGGSLVFKFLRSGFDSILSNSATASGMVDKASLKLLFGGLYEFAHSDISPKCPYVNIVKPWRHTIEQLEKAYRSVTNRGEKPPPGFQPYKFKKVFLDAVGLEAIKKLGSIRGMNEVKQLIESIVIDLHMGKQLKLPFNGFGSFIFTGNPGTGKSEVAEALVEVIRGVVKTLGGNDGDDEDATKHSLRKYKKPSIECWRCGMRGPSSQTGQKECSKCRLCHTCCKTDPTCNSAEGKKRFKQKQRRQNPFGHHRGGSDSDEKSDEDEGEHNEDDDEEEDEDTLLFHKATGSELLLEGPEEFKKLLAKFTKHPKGGVIFIDEADQLSPATDRGGAHIVNLFMLAMELHQKKLSIIIAGYEDDIDKLLSFNKGLRGRFAHTFKFRDYNEGELYELYFMFLEKLGDGKVTVEVGHEQAVAIVARRMGRAGRQKGFCNARLVRQSVNAALTRCKNRLFSVSVGSRVGKLRWEDILGICPISHLKQHYKPIETLQGMIGFPTIKRKMLDTLMMIVELMIVELSGQRIEDAPLNQRFYGNPGTGKTTLAEIYAHVLCDLGIVEKNDVVVGLPTQLKGSAVGEAENNVRSLMERARQKVLFIDEAYQLMDDSPYSAAMTEALTSEISPSPSFRPIVVIAGYEDRMEKMLTNANPGLYRRLAPNPALVFEGGDFSEADLSLVLREKLQLLHGGSLSAMPSRKVIDHAVKLLLLQKQRPNFGNGGNVANLATNALNSMKCRHATTLVETDFGMLPIEEEPTAVLRPGSSLMEWYRRKNAQVKRCRERGVIPNWPMLFAFVGGPGTGKKTEARELLKLLNNMQLTSGKNYKEVSVSAIVGQHVGSSTPKLLNLLRESLGGLVTITSADRLADSSYGHEVFRELIDCSTKSEFKGKVCIVLCGRQERMEDMFGLEPGSRSLFEVVEFSTPSPQDCATIAFSYIRSQQLPVPPELCKPFAEAIAAIQQSFIDAGADGEFAYFRVAKTLVDRLDMNLEGRRWTMQAIDDEARSLFFLKKDSSLPSKPRSAATGAFAQQLHAAMTASVATARTTAAASSQPPPEAHDTAKSLNMKTAAAENIIQFKKQATPVRLEETAALLEEAVAAGIVSHEKAVEIAQQTDFEKDDPESELPQELMHFFRRKGLTGDRLQKEIRSMRKRMIQAKKDKQTVCPICFLPEDAAQQIGCPWNFR